MLFRTRSIHSIARGMELAACLAANNKIIYGSLPNGSSVLQSSLLVHEVVCKSASINWYGDIVRPLIVKEDGEAMARKYDVFAGSRSPLL